MVISNLHVGKAWFSYPMSLFRKGLWLALLGSAGLSIQSAEAKPQRSKWQKENTVAVSLKAQPALRNGIYLYGSHQQPEQTQTEYFVFKVHNQQVIGAFYMPQSSFDCFRGDLKAKALELTVMSYEQQAYKHSVNLNAYHSIDQVSNNDHRMIETCQADRKLAALD